MPGIRVGTIATIWQNANGVDHIVIIHEALYFGDRMSSSLLCPNQLRDHGNIVDDVPRQYTASSTHSIYVPSDKLSIPLSLDGVLSGFSCRKPTWPEYNDASLPRCGADIFSQPQRTGSTTSSKSR